MPQILLQMQFHLLSGRIVYVSKADTGALTIDAQDGQPLRYDEEDEAASAFIRAQEAMIK